jgi:hypothetical protein
MSLTLVWLLYHMVISHFNLGCAHSMCIPYLYPIKFLYPTSSPQNTVSHTIDVRIDYIPKRYHYPRKLCMWSKHGLFIYEGECSSIHLYSYWYTHDFWIPMAWDGWSKAPWIIQFALHIPWHSHCWWNKNPFEPLRASLNHDESH